jgi:hypothetical protein
MIEHHCPAGVCWNMKDIRDCQGILYTIEKESFYDFTKTIRHEQMRNEKQRNNETAIDHSLNKLLGTTTFGKDRSTTYLSPDVS